MITVGVTTIRRWMVEYLSHTFESYLIGPDGTFVKLAGLRVTPGHLEAACFKLGTARPRLFSRVSMDTPVYLCEIEKDVAGRTPAEVNLVVAADTSGRGWITRSVEDASTTDDANAAAPICCG